MDKTYTLKINLETLFSFALAVSAVVCIWTFYAQVVLSPLAEVSQALHLALK